MDASTPSQSIAALRHHESKADDAQPWTFLTNHGHVLLCLAEAPDSSLREVALRVGITERSVQRIVADLEHAGYIAKERIGRGNHYVIAEQAPLRHPVEAHRSVHDLIAMVRGTDRPR